MVDNMWRQSPDSASDSNMHYVPDFFIEERLDESALHKINLPLLSRKAIEEIAKGDQLDSEELSMMEMLAMTIRKK